MTIADEELIAFLDGELPDDRLAAVEAALAADPALADRAEALAASDHAVRAAFDAVLKEPVPPALLAAATPATPAVIDLAAVRAARQQERAAPVAGRLRWWQPAALAASLAIGFVIGNGVPQSGDAAADPLIIADAAGTRAGPTLAAALAGTRSGTDTTLPGGVLRPVISVRAEDGRLCRQFGIQQAQSAITALACRTGNQWQIVVASSTAATRTDYALAAGPGEAAITAALEALGAGEPLDAAGEAAALAKP